jgi:hypothetical protein
VPATRLWLMILLPNRPGHLRNPVGTLERQAGRWLAVLGALCVQRARRASNGAARPTG